MLWFRPKKFKLIIKDEQIWIRMCSTHPIDGGLNYLSFMPHDELHELVREGKLSPNVEQVIAAFRALSEKALFRGINKHMYKDFLRYGNTKPGMLKHPTWGHSQEAAFLRENGIDPSEVMYASYRVDKAWEYACRQHPSILVLYDEGKFDLVRDTVNVNYWNAPEGIAYLYRIKKGENFNDAVKAYFIIEHPWTL